MTPAGLASWPKLDVPDTKYNDDGEYGVKLLLDPNNEQHVTFMALLDSVTDASMETMKADEKNKKYIKLMKRADPYTAELDKEGEETGLFVANFTCPAKFIRKSDKKEWPNKPVLVDAKLTPLPADAKIGGGSRIKIKFETWPYFNATEKKVGMTKRLIAVQVLDLKVWDRSTDIAALGFDAEDGFSVSDAPAEQSAESKAAPASDF